MSTIFPLREKIRLDDGREPRLVDLDDDVADEVFTALAARTTREIFASLHEEPRTASDLADVTDTSVQNVQYHLEKLSDADLIEVVDTWYSERGTEMKVYAPTDESLVLFAGDDKERSLRTLLKRIVGVLALLLPGSAAVAWLARQFAGGAAPRTGAGADPQPVTGAATDTPGPAATPTPDAGDAGGLGAESVDQGATPTDTPVPSPTETPAEVADAAVDAVNGGLDPALVAGGAFLLGGLVVLAVLVAWSR